MQYRQPLVGMSCHDSSHSLTAHLHKCYPVAMQNAEDMNINTIMLLLQKQIKQAHIPLS